MDVKAEVAKIKKLVDKNTESIETFQEVIDEMADKIKGLDAAKESKSSLKVSKEDKRELKKPIVKIGDNTYQFALAKFQIKDKKYIAEDIVKDKPLLESILADHPSVLIKQ